MSNLPSLINISLEMQELTEKIKESEGVLSEQDELKLTELIAQSESKVSNYCLILDKYESEIEFVKKRISEAKEYVDRLERQKEKLTSIALSVVVAKGSKLNGQGGRWLSKKQSTKLLIFDESKIPVVYTKLKVELDKAAIKKALAEGEKIEGATLISEDHLTWK